MSAIITDQLRILNAKNFAVPLHPRIQIITMLLLGCPMLQIILLLGILLLLLLEIKLLSKKMIIGILWLLSRILSGNVQHVVKRTAWQSGTTYDMYRHDVSRTKTSKPSEFTNLYLANYFVVNDDFRVYICLKNGSDPENPTGKPSLDQPTFVDLEPRAAGDSGDGYIWKYLYTIKPSDILKFDSTNYIPVPKNWETDSENLSIRNNAATSGQIKVVTVTNRGAGIGTGNRTYSEFLSEVMDLVQKQP